MSAPSYLLGIDGGGTKSRARLRARDGTLLGEGLAGPSNIRLGMTAAWAQILAATDTALSGAGLDRGIFPQTSIGLGLAGIVDDESARATVAHGPRFGHAAAVSDAQIACLGAFDGGDGAILISGTGCAGHVSVGNRQIAVSGWGLVVGDRASAAGLGRAAVMRSLDAWDGLCDESGLTSAVLQELGGTRAAIVDWTGAALPYHYGGLARIVMAHAETGDRVALDLVRECATALERIIQRLIGLGAPHVCLVGGMAERMAPWLSPWARGTLRPARHDAVEGALILALSPKEAFA